MHACRCHNYYHAIFTLYARYMHALCFSYSMLHDASPFPMLFATALVCVQASAPVDFPANRHRSNAMELIARVPVIEVDGHVAMCDGGGGATGA